MTSAAFFFIVLISSLLQKERPIDEVCRVQHQGHPAKGRESFGSDTIFGDLGWICDVDQVLSTAACLQQSKSDASELRAVIFSPEVTSLSSDPSLFQPK